MIAFVQSFGLQTTGGGPRIMRALLTDATFSFLSISTDVTPPPPTVVAREIHLPVRPRLGRLERTRIGRWGYLLERALSDRFVRRLRDVVERERCTAIHGLAHGLDFLYAYRVAAQLGLSYYLAVHDDLAYALRGRPELKDGLEALAHIWPRAAGRFVISDAMGDEYCRRYGHKSYEVITDGLEEVRTDPRPRHQGRLALYFMGLLHRSYIPNFRALLSALAELARSRPDLRISLTCRCGSLPNELADLFPVTLLPFGSEADVERDLKQADVLYLPLPFTAEDELFVRYSLSTKMITYLGSGVPIVYHGPVESASGQILARHGAACAVNSLDVREVVDGLLTPADSGSSIVDGALRLARESFLLERQRQRFLDVIKGNAEHERIPATASV